MEKDKMYHAITGFAISIAFGLVWGPLSGFLLGGAS